jgi:hypothetical protein
MAASGSVNGLTRGTPVLTTMAVALQCSTNCRQKSNCGEGGSANHFPSTPDGGTEAKRRK